MAEQLVFDLPIRPAMGRDDFFVSGANAAAVAQIEGWRDWPHGKLILAGPMGAGKTHLAHVWAGLTDARMVAAATLAEVDIAALAEVPALVVDDADAVAGRPEGETALFHLHNACAGRGVPLLLTARDGPQRWGLGLPDLDSRMRQAGLVRLDPPDDALLMAVMMKLAHDRALRLTPGILTHVAPRIERSFAAAQGFVEALDARALAAKRPPKRKDAKAVLAEMEANVSR